MKERLTLPYLCKEDTSELTRKKIEKKIKRLYDRSTKMKELEEKEWNELSEKSEIVQKNIKKRGMQLKMEKYIEEQVSLEQIFKGEQQKISKQEERLKKRLCKKMGVSKGKARANRIREKKEANLYSKQTFLTSTLHPTKCKNKVIQHTYKSNTLYSAPTHSYNTPFCATTTKTLYSAVQDQPTLSPSSMKLHSLYILHSLSLTPLYYVISPLPNTRYSFFSYTIFLYVLRRLLQLLFLRLWDVRSFLRRCCNLLWASFSNVPTRMLFCGGF